MPVVPWSIARSIVGGACPTRSERTVRSPADAPGRGPSPSTSTGRSPTTSRSSSASTSDLFAEQGRPLTEADYYDTLAGRSEEAIIGTWLGVEGDDARRARRGAHRPLPRQIAGRGETVSATVRDAVAYAAARVPVAVVSGAFRRGDRAGAGRRRSSTRHISVARRGRRRRAREARSRRLRAALELLGDGSPQARSVAFEDTEAGVASAKAAGLRCVAVAGTHPPDRLAPSRRARRRRSSRRSSARLVA